MDQALLDPPRRERTIGRRHADAPAAQRIPGIPRADAQLRTRVQRALEQAGHRPLRDLRVFVDHGQVVLQGVLPNYYLTQLALTRAMNVEGVARVRHEIQVSDPIH